MGGHRNRSITGQNEKKNGLFIFQDRGGDTNLIHAAKAGHKSIVEALLKKYADVDMTGKVNWLIEMNNYVCLILIVLIILNAGEKNWIVLGC